MNVISYVTTAKDTLTRNDILPKVVGFYKNDTISAAKDFFFSFCNEHPVKRKVTTEHPNSVVINVKDILPLLDKIEGKVSFPSFVTAKYNSLLSSIFEPSAAVLCSLIGQ